jgi:DNA modification methylase
MSAPKIRLVKASTLKPYDRNARTHSAGQIQQIADSLRKFGFTSPILADEHGVIAGHGRLAAALLLLGEGEALRFPDGSDIPLGLVPVIDVAGWDEAQRRAYILADNQLALNAGWDEALLRDELAALSALDFQIESIGFDMREITRLLNRGSDEGATDPDETPEVPAIPVTLPGDLWILGNHRLICGDCTRPEVVAELLDGHVMDLLLTDPPYSSGGRQDAGKRHTTSVGTRASKLGSIARDNLTTKGYMALMRDVLTGIDAETAYVFTDWRMWTWTYDALESAGYPVRNMLVWDKQHMGMGFPWRAQHELIAFAKRSGAEMMDGKHGNVIECTRQRNELHPTQKPVELLTIVLGNDVARTVIDPFSGSGTTLMAAQVCGRQAFGIELAPGFVDVTVERWQAYTEAEAVLASTGQTFAEVRAEREKERT